MQLLKPHQFTAPAIEWGVKREAEAIQLQQQHRNGHDGLTVCSVGFHVSHSHPFLGATPDSSVYDPSGDQPYGFLEVKCPYSHRNHTPTEACSDKSFYCTLETTNKGNIVKLRENHNYFCQVQGQMAVYTLHGITVERINFDPEFWDKHYQVE